jgi:Ras-related protein Rab-8A
MTEHPRTPSDQDRAYSHAAKIVVVGEAGVGKTSIIVRFCKGFFNPEYLSTIGVNFFVQDVKMSTRILRFQIWDTAGQEQFSPLRRRYYVGAKGAILVYDKSSSSSYRKLDHWIQDIWDGAGQVPIVLVGNKADLAEAIGYEFGEQFARTYQLSFIETSAKTGMNVSQVFTTLAPQVIEYIHKASQSID